MYNNLSQAPAYYYVPQQFQRGAAAAQGSLDQTPTQTAMTGAPYPMPSLLPAQQNFIKGRPVVSIDEARASQIDLDGSLYVFPDLGNKKIYTKQINMDGTATFNVFELTAPAKEAPAPVYVTKDELDEILTNFKASLVQAKPKEAAPAPKPTQNFNL